MRKNETPAAISPWISINRSFWGCADETNAAQKDGRKDCPVPQKTPARAYQCQESIKEGVRMNFTSNDMSRFEELLSSHEDWLMKRLLYHARRVIDIGDGASVEEAWRRCVRGLSGALKRGNSIF
jgi:hypothetical protein